MSINHDVRTLTLSVDAASSYNKFNDCQKCLALKFDRKKLLNVCLFAYDSIVLHLNDFTIV